ncbi:MAG TPA: sigma-70 family RNA polymerase sigma factor [Polyangia bacterium]|jgi:RNA polymerase sigma factor (sigma-70 family)|nr:sigma-70 family RNA polymerase sigma factor [Polyangia bacterium]
MFSGEDIEKVLARDPVAVRRFVEKVGPVLQAVAHVVVMRRRLPPHMEEDLVQDVFIDLLRDDGAALRKWSPTRGPFEPYLRTWARSRILDLLRVQGRLGRGGRDVSSDDQKLAELLEASVQTLGGAAGQYDWVDEMVERYHQECSREERLFFQRCVEERDTNEFMKEFGLNPDAVYKRKQRQRDRLLQIAREILGDRTDPTKKI